jgi:hypothetical protein
MMRLFALIIALTLAISLDGSVASGNEIQKRVALSVVPHTKMSISPLIRVDSLDACIHGHSSCGQYNATYGKYCANDEVVCFNPQGNGLDECVPTCLCTNNC